MIKCSKTLSKEGFTVLYLSWYTISRFVPLFCNIYIYNVTVFDIGLHFQIHGYCATGSVYKSTHQTCDKVLEYTASSWGLAPKPLLSNIVNSIQCQNIIDAPGMSPFAITILVRIINYKQGRKVLFVALYTSCIWFALQEQKKIKNYHFANFSA